MQKVWPILFLLWLPGPVLAQEEETGALAGGNSAGLGFRQEFNTYLWSGHVAVDQQVSSRWSVSFNENFRSSMLRIASEGDRWKDDQNVGLRVSYRLLPSLALQTQFLSLVFLDKQSGFDNDIRSHSGAVGFVYTPAPQIYSNLVVGPKLDSRYYHDDSGFFYNLNARGSDLEWEGYDNSLEVTLGQDRYDRRNNANQVVSYRVNRQFSTGAADTLNLFYNAQRRDNYASISGDIESQRDNTKGLRNALFYRVNPLVNLNLRSSLEFKNVELVQYGLTAEDRRRKRNDQRVSNDLDIAVSRKKLRGLFSLSHWFQEQRYDFSINGRPFSERTAFVTPNNTSSRLMASANITGRLTARDSTAAYFSVSRFRYDTPDSTNFDDRDELRINTRVSFSHWFSPELRLELLASVNLYHIVYIFGERSADNNWNRIFLLRPALEYRPNQQLRLQQSFEVLANYVDYDFDDITVQTRSFVFRKFAMTDSLSWRLLPRSTLLCDYRLQLEENGQLYWDQWAQNLVADRVQQWLHVYWRYDFPGRFHLVPGYSVHKRDEWRYQNLAAAQTQRRDKVGTYISHGPILRVEYTPRPNLRLAIDATRYRVSVSDQDDYYINNIDLNVRWLF